MEILAENRFTITKRLFYEGMLRVSGESYGKFAKKAVAFLILAWVILGAVTLWLRQSLGYVGAESVVVLLACLWITVYMPRNKAKRAFQALQSRSGDLERVTRFYRDHLEVEAAGVQTPVDYGEITQILRTKRLLILLTADNTGVLLKLDSFCTGSEAVVRDLIGQARGQKEQAEG